jgi:hypothetical protein
MVLPTMNATNSPGLRPPRYGCDKRLFIDQATLAERSQTTNSQLIDTHDTTDVAPIASNNGAAIRGG